MASEEITRTKIIMLGGRRSGKSTILATLIHALNNESAHLCAFNDNTPYGASSGMQVPLVDKRREIENYMRNRTKFGNNSQFIVDMSPNVGEGDYNIVASVKGASRIGFDFVDVPGEWMQENHEKHPTLQKHVEESDVFVIAIDTPYLMHEDNPNVNSVWNRIDEITNLMSHMKIENSANRKLVLFVPVKCEKWVKEGKIDQVTERVKQAYRTMINTWVDNDGVEMWVMPIVTAGGIEHVRLLDAYRFYRTEKDKVGEICSQDPLTGILMLKDGKTLFDSMVDSIEPDPDKSYCISYTQIPLSWYKTSGEGKFKPYLCEQVAYHILRFLVKKEEDLSSMKYKAYKNDPWWIRIFNRAGRRFGQYLPVYKELINKIPIKLGGDGFAKIDSHVQEND